MTHRNLLVTIIIICLCIVQQFATDCYLPALPAIAKSFNTTNASLQLSITFFLFGAVPAQFIFGTLSDSLGRRPLYLIGILFFVISSIYCVYAINIHMFLFGRFLQGFGIGSGSVLAWATARDMFSGKQFSQFISTIAAIALLIPIISPIVGGYIQLYLGWQYIFVLLLIMGGILLVAILAMLPETLKNQDKQALHFNIIYRSYVNLLTNKIFLTNGLIACFATATVITYITITPFLYQHVLHLTPIFFSWVTAAIALSAACGCITNAKLVEKIVSTKLIIIGISIMLTGVMLMLIFALLHVLNLYVILFPMLLVSLSIGFIIPNATSRAMAPFEKSAGCAAAVYSSMQMFIFACCSALAALFQTTTQIPLAFLLLAIAIVVVLLFRLSNSR